MRIFEAQHNLPWVIEGAAVAVSIVCFAPETDRAAGTSTLDGRQVRAIRSDLRDMDLAFDLRDLRSLAENHSIAFQGVKLAGRRADDDDDDEERGFVIDEETAYTLLAAGGNPNARPNSDVVKRYWSGDEALGRSRLRYVIDFGPAATEAEAQAYSAPYTHVDRFVRNRRQGNRESRAANRWWIHQRARKKMREAIADLDRFLVTVEVAKHRTFRWAPAGVLPSGSLVVFARSDNFFLGVLESRFHKLWANETHNPLEDRPRYRIGHSFESFPFPPDLTPNLPVEDIMANPLAVAIANEAQALYAARESALTSGPTQMDITELYDLQREGGAAWLTNAHQKLDLAVAAAYRFPDNLSDDEILAHLGELHQARQSVAFREDQVEATSVENGAEGRPV